MTDITKVYKTLTDKTINEAIRELMKVLPPEAYKAVGGTTVNLTDINPSYLNLVFTRSFGPCGIGWWFDHTEPKISSEVRTSRQGNENTYFTVIIDTLWLYYAYTDEEGNLHESKAILGSGASDNTNVAWALKGATTNALGSAANKLLWQHLVYAGKVNHNNAGQWYAKQKAKEASQGNGEQEEENIEETEVVQDAEPVYDSSPEPEYAEAQDEPEVQDEPAEETEDEDESAQKVPMFAEYQENWDAETKIAWANGMPAAEYLALPGGGGSLGDIATQSFGTQVLEYLSGEKEGVDGKFTPENQYEMYLKGAAKILLQSAKSNGKKK